MFRVLAVAFALSLSLTACAPQASTTKAEEAAMTSPLDKYVPWNPDAKGIQTLDSGIQYIVAKEGPKDGKKPVATDRVRVHYDGRLPTGEKFDSSFDRGTAAEFRLDQVIPGWTLGLQEMREGDEYVFYIPNHLAYGQQARGNVIKAGDDLVFFVSLLDIVEPKKSDAAAWTKYYPWNPELSEVQTTESGLQYVVLKSGDAEGKSPVGGQLVVVHYEGRLAETGELFDSSYQRGDPEVFPSNALISGWVEALSMMKPGDHWMLHIPSDLGYGEEGTPGGPIPPNAALQFEVELLDVLQ
ncbi:FKBP-type peptidyl-prolyl cis-trans isomerase [Hyphomonas sp. WL0036]|uniref:FKBP-type peptidyl-prolyl cis-trans isomerase n=1 Tax=Hyphomonas sediminis TaxID=2866160 RepID=UPI001C81CCED|nr:FKBP-type peptidyl-prolyl cis-trans isomerase [Hyphomonas sediminis]MBY9066204.1 FKBP-type peptidyl-prolyl cis-trans isomerase [Hyphomonas sediminis]